MKAKALLIGCLLLGVAPLCMAADQREPMEAGMQEAQLCTQPTIDTVAAFLNQPNLELKPDDGEPLDSHLVTAACKVNPADRKQTIVALAYDAGQQESKALVIALLDNAHQRVLADYQGDIGEDATMSVEAGSLWIDTADYALAKGVRAFAVDEISGYQPHCGDGGIGPTRYLYVREGKRIRPVLTGLDTSRWEFIQRGQDRCNSDADPDAKEIIGDTDLSLAIAPTSTHGYHDLEVTAVFSRDDGKPVRNYDDNPCGVEPFQFLLHYNGREYPTDQLETALGCGDRWRPMAVVVKLAKAEPVTANGVPVQFMPSMRVSILDRKPHSLLVQRVLDARRIGWIPRNAAVLPDAFRELHAWRGPPTFKTGPEDYDNGVIYRFKSDGSYTFVVEGSNHAGVGHLYAYGPVVEARDSSSYSRFYWLRPDGSLCNLTKNGECVHP